MADLPVSKVPGTGKFDCLIMRGHHSGRIIYVGKKHMNITIEGCTTPRGSIHQ